ncbi:putative leader peptide [Streptomyces sp. NPDC052309]|nr:putative leader peptide [Streptomyces griseicoloratus]
MARLQPATSRVSRTPGPSLPPSPLLTSRRHIDLLRVCSAISSLR